VTRILARYAYPCSIKLRCATLYWTVRFKYRYTTCTALYHTVLYFCLALLFCLPSCLRASRFALCYVVGGSLVRVQCRVFAQHCPTLHWYTLHCSFVSNAVKYSRPESGPVEISARLGLSPALSSAPELPWLSEGVRHLLVLSEVCMSVYAVVSGECVCTKGCILALQPLFVEKPFWALIFTGVTCREWCSSHPVLISLCFARVLYQ
jgi:hypothetical protein